MKLASLDRQVHRSEDLASGQTFRVKTGAKLMDILSNKLYSNKWAAVVREYCCNALDAHTASGVTRPFTVLAPTDTNPQLVIRDYGAGLSIDALKNIFTVYFESTKAHSNADVGGFGLGCKAGFAVGDMFMVRSFHGGRVINTACVKNEEGIPDLVILNEEPTDETGLEIQIPVAPEDFLKCKFELSRVLKWFPEDSFEGFGFVKADRVTRMISGAGWYLSPNTGANTSLAVMGPVAYPIDWHAAGFKDYYQYRDLGAGLVLEFEIGDLDLPPSREALSYDEPTKKKLLDRYKQVISELRARTQAELSAKPSRYEAVVALTAMRNHRNELANLAEAIGKDYDYQGLKITAGELRPADGSMLKVFYQGRRNSDAEGGYCLGRSEDQYVSLSKSRRVDFVWNDLFGKQGQHLEQRMRLRLRANNWRTIVLLNGYSTLQEAKDAIGNPPDDWFLTLSEMPGGFVKTTASGTRVKALTRDKYEIWETETVFSIGHACAFVPFEGADFDVSKYGHLLRHPFVRKSHHIVGLTKVAQAKFKNQLPPDLVDWAVGRAQAIINTHPNILKQIVQLDTYFDLEEGKRAAVTIARDIGDEFTKDLVWNRFVRETREAFADMYPSINLDMRDFIKHMINNGLLPDVTLPAAPDLSAFDAISAKRPFFQLMISQLRNRLHREPADRMQLYRLLEVKG